MKRIRSVTVSEPMVRLQKFEDSLKIDENALEEALQEQAYAFYEVSSELALQISRRDQAKQNLEIIEAEVDADIRHDAAVAEEKITEKEVASQKRLNTDVRKANEELLVLNQAVGQLEALKEAFKQRSYVLKELVALYIHNYYGNTEGSHQQNPTSQMKDNDARIAREAMNRARREAR